ncbi:MAG: glycosyltransferase, partial [bacterium]|nr:glycosyltransferase [bacterium]
FGIPVVEAMAMGTPVVISRVSSLPEIGGGIASYVNPLSTESIKNGIIETLKNPPEREKLIDRAKSFSWEKCAKETLTVLFEIINENHSSKNLCFRSGGSGN